MLSAKRRSEELMHGQGKRTNAALDIGAANGFGLGALLSTRYGLGVLAVVLCCAAYYAFLRWTGVIKSRKSTILDRPRENPSAQAPPPTARLEDAGRRQ